MPDNRPRHEALLRCVSLSGAAQAEAMRVINEITHPDSPGGLQVTADEAAGALNTIQGAIMWLHFLGELVAQAAQEYEEAAREYAEGCKPQAVNGRDKAVRIAT